MSFDNVATPEGLKHLNEYLADNSYLAGWVPSQVDVNTFHAVDKAYGSGVDKSHVNASRWFNHIKSFSEEERARFPAGEVKAAAPKTEEKQEKKAEAGGDDDDVDLFGDVDEAELEKENERRRAEAAAKKKPAIIAKSNLILDVKPFDDQTDMAEVEEKVRAVTLDGLLWGPSKLVEIAFGIKKLQICATIEDDKVMTEDVEEKIMEWEDLVQSVDVASFTKV